MCIVIINQVIIWYFLNQFILFFLQAKLLEYINYILNTGVFYYNAKSHSRLKIKLLKNFEIKNLKRHF